MTPPSIGPGRLSALARLRSSSDCGCMSSRIFLPPTASSWKTPSVSARPSSAYVGASSSGIASTSILSPVVCRMFSRASSMTLRLVSPRKSIFSRPICWTPSMSNWVTTASRSLVDRCSGTKFISGSGAMTTPAAWVLAFRQMPSSRRALSMICLAQSSFS